MPEKDNSTEQVKERIRAIIRDRRSSLPQEIQGRCADVLTDSLEDLVVNELKIKLKDLTVASYMPVRGELSSLPFCKRVMDEGGTVLMPRVTGDGLVFCKVNDLKDSFVKGSYGIPEPVDSCEVCDIRSADILIVPAIAYNDEGIRLGQGGGYFDRVWAYLGGDSPEREAVIAGVCYDFQMISSIPVSELDMVVDVLLQVDTEEDIG